MNPVGGGGFDGRDFPGCFVDVVDEYDVPDSAGGRTIDSDVTGLQC